MLFSHDGRFSYVCPVNFAAVNADAFLINGDRKDIFGLTLG